MNDPHVESLIYAAAPSKEDVFYKDPPPVDFENSIGRFELSDGELKFSPADHFADVQSARDAVTDFLKAWELRADLDGNPGVIQFTYKNAKVIDRDPPPPGTSRIVKSVLSDAISLSATVNAKISVGKAAYPEPPTDFDVSAEVETAHMRWLRFKDGKETLQSASYFILTLLEGAAMETQAENSNRPASNKRKRAADRYGIDIDTLQKIGELSSTTGTNETSRKAGARPITSEENSWLEKAIRDVIIQLGKIPE